MSNLELYDDVFKSLFNFKNASELKYGSNGWDSAGHLILIAELESAFNIKLSLEDVLNFKSYLYGIEILKKYGVVFDNK